MFFLVAQARLRVLKISSFFMGSVITFLGWLTRYILYGPLQLTKLIGPRLQSLSVGLINNTIQLQIGLSIKRENQLLGSLFDPYLCYVGHMVLGYINHTSRQFLLKVQPNLTLPFVLQPLRHTAISFIYHNGTKRKVFLQHSVYSFSEHNTQ